MRILIAIIICLVSCQSKDELRKLNYEEVLELIHNRSFNYYHASYLDEFENPLSDSLRQLLNQGKLARDFYINKAGEIQQVRVRKLKEEDILNEIVIRGSISYIMTNKDQFTLTEVDCDSIPDLVNRVHSIDQGVRMGTIEGSIFETDKENRTIVLSIVKKCGWTAFQDSIVPKVFYVFQHMPDDYIAVSFPFFLKHADKGILPLKQLALMEDRLRMNNAFPQKFGTQLNGESFYQIEDPYNVNKRRAEYGMDSIEKVAESRGFVFNPENHLN